MVLVRRGLSTAVSSVVALSLIFISTLYFISISENALDVLNEVSRGSGAVGVLEVRSITVYVDRIEVEVFNKGSSTVAVEEYYIRSGSGGIYTGSLSEAIPPASSRTIVISGSFNPDETYYIAFIDSSASMHSFSYPLQQAGGSQVEMWSMQTLQMLNWNRSVVSADMDTVYTLDYADVQVGTVSAVKGSIVAGGVQELSTLDGQTLDVVSAPTSSSIYIYYPSTATAVSGSIESGSVADLQASDDIYLVLKPDIEVYAPAVYLYYPENITFITSTYYKLRIQDPGTASPVSFSGSASLPSFSTVCFQTESWAYPLQPYAGRTIPAGTWTVYYNAWYSSSGFLLDAYAIVDIAVVDTAGNKNYIATGFARASLSTTAGSIVFASDNFPGYTVSPQDRYLVVEPFLCFRTFFSVTVTAYFVVNTTNTRIEAPQTFAYIYSATVDLSGSSNTASDWLSLKVDLEASASVGGVSGYVSLFNYQTGSFQTAPPGYTAISFSTTDTVYSIAVQDQDAPENFRDPSTGGFTIRIYASRQVDWNEDFRLYIDLASFKPETVDRYEARVRLYSSSVPQQNIYSVAVNATAYFNTTVSDVAIELYNFDTGVADTIYFTLSVSSISAYSEAISSSYISQNGEVEGYIHAVLLSPDAKPFLMSIDLFYFRVGVVNASALIIATGGGGNLTIFYPLSLQEREIATGLQLGNVSIASNGTGVYIVSSGLPDLYFVDTLSGTLYTVSTLPAQASTPIIVLSTSTGELMYIPNYSSPVAYIYDQSLQQWVASVSLPFTEPVDNCEDGSGYIVCVSGTTIYVLDPQASYGLIASYSTIESSRVIGIGFSEKQSLFYILYQSASLYVFNITSGEISYAGSTPSDLAIYFSVMHLDLVEVDLFSIYIVKPLSKTLYIRSI